MDCSERDLRFLSAVATEVLSRPPVRSHVLMAQSKRALVPLDKISLDPLPRLKVLHSHLELLAAYSTGNKAEQRQLSEALSLVAWTLRRLAEFRHLISILAISNKPALLQLEALRPIDLLLDAELVMLEDKKRVKTRLILLNRLWLVAKEKKRIGPLEEKRWMTIFEGQGGRACLRGRVCETKLFFF